MKAMAARRGHTADRARRTAREVSWRACAIRYLKRNQAGGRRNVLTLVAVAAAAAKPKAAASLCRLAINFN